MPVYAPFALTYTPEPVRCAGGVKPGTQLLQDWACNESPWAADLYDLGTYVCRTIAGSTKLSSHASGRAGDSGCKPTDPQGNPWVNPAGTAFAHWLVANHAVLGIQEVIWNRRRWTNQTQEWRTYTGDSPHLDHVHWAQNQSGALYLTRDRLLSVAPQEVKLVYLIVWFQTSSGAKHAYRCLFAQGKTSDVPVEAWWIPNQTSLKRWRGRLAERPASDPIRANPFTVIWNGPAQNFRPAA